MTAATRKALDKFSWYVVGGIPAVMLILITVNFMKLHGLP